MIACRQAMPAIPTLFTRAGKSMTTTGMTTMISTRTRTSGTHGELCLTSPFRAQEDEGVPTFLTTQIMMRSSTAKHLRDRAVDNGLRQVELDPATGTGCQESKNAKTRSRGLPFLPIGDDRLFQPNNPITGLTAAICMPVLAIQYCVGPPMVVKLMSKSSAQNLAGQSTSQVFFFYARSRPSSIV